MVVKIFFVIYIDVWTFLITIPEPFIKRGFTVTVYNLPQTHLLSILCDTEHVPSIYGLPACYRSY